MKTKEEIEIKVGQVWEDHEGTFWTVRYNANKMLGVTEAPPAYPGRTCICSIDVPHEEGWKLITDVQP